MRSGSSSRASPAGRSSGRAARSRPRRTRSRPRPAEDGERIARCDQVPGDDRHRRRGNRGTGPAIRRLLWPRDLDCGQPGRAQVEMIRKRRLPVVGNGAGIWSLVHILDAAAATAAALDHGEPGVYNVVDDEPAPVSDDPPRAGEGGRRQAAAAPPALGRTAARRGGNDTIMMTEVRGASNEKAKRELGWELRYPSWRLGFQEGLEQKDRHPRRLGMNETVDARARTQGRFMRPRRGRSRSPTGCSAASARPRTSSRRPCCGSTTRSSRGRRSPRRGPMRPRWPLAWRSTSCARPEPGARPTSGSGCPSP